MKREEKNIIDNLLDIYSPEMLLICLFSGNLGESVSDEDKVKLLCIDFDRLAKYIYGGDYKDNIKHKQE